MKKLLILLGFLSITPFCYSVDYEVKNYTITDFGTIFINVEYTLDNGNKILNPYAACFENFEGKTETEQGEFIRANLLFQCDQYLERGLQSKPKYLETQEKLVDISSKEIKEPEPEESFLTEDINIPIEIRQAKNKALVGGDLAKFIGMRGSKTTIAWFVDEKGKLITPYFITKNKKVKEIEIQTDGSYVEKDIN